MLILKVNYVFTPFFPYVEEGWSYLYMGQGMLFSRGSRYSEIEDPNVVGWSPKTLIVNSDTDWIVPKSAGQKFTVQIFGGGAGISSICKGGAGGGYMSKSVLTLSENEHVSIKIGQGGTINQNGGTTSFGQYLSALGGETSKFYREEYGGWNYDEECANVQFEIHKGGNGGTGGGGFIQIIVVDRYYYPFETVLNYIQSRYSIGGDAQYGGGGGGLIGGKGGNLGGAGGGWTVPAKDGINTIDPKYNEEYRGSGKAGKQYENYFYGSGLEETGYFCGGGGYGGIGGAACSYVDHPYHDLLSIWCGGGGGWGDNGYNGSIYYNNDFAGSGGGYGPSHYGAGAYKNKYADAANTNGKPGICIIKYYEPIYINA